MEKEHYKKEELDYCFAIVLLKIAKNRKMINSQTYEKSLAELKKEFKEVA